jgi:hypothetical protein
MKEKTLKEYIEEKKAKSINEENIINQSTQNNQSTPNADTLPPTASNLPSAEDALKTASQSRK